MADSMSGSIVLGLEALVPPELDELVSSIDRFIRPVSPSHTVPRSLAGHLHRLAILAYQDPEQPDTPQLTTGDLLTASGASRESLLARLRYDMGCSTKSAVICLFIIENRFLYYLRQFGSQGLFLADIVRVQPVNATLLPFPAEEDVPFEVSRRRGTSLSTLATWAALKSSTRAPVPLTVQPILLTPLDQFYPRGSFRLPPNRFDDRSSHND
jgi:hypothetical protein